MTIVIAIIIVVISIVMIVAIIIFVMIEMVMLLSSDHHMLAFNLIHCVCAKSLVYSKFFIHFICTE